VSFRIILRRKAVQSQATDRDARPLLFLALTGALTPGPGLTILCFLFPGWLVRIIFTDWRIVPAPRAVGAEVVGPRGLALQRPITLRFLLPGSQCRPTGGYHASTPLHKLALSPRTG